MTTKSKTAAAAPTKNVVEIEEGLEVLVEIKPTDMRLLFLLRRFTKLSKISDASDKDFTEAQLEEFMDVIATLLEILLKKDGLEKVIDFYVEKHEEFSVDDMSLVIEKAFGANEKK